ncbi:hypothetical protein NQ317_003458 [Molorchus minor]|uniref:Uncharacterized protein n=1 Tax=Molorchus minor TaxID=1323400 RepID=A0ABQ9JZ81_9CUCU|nr:hypothetical protein NQ317_003458 [Molorchus minor]
MKYNKISAAQILCTVTSSKVSMLGMGSHEGIFNETYFIFSKARLTSSHVLTECPAIARVRERHFGSSVLNPKNVKRIPPRKLCTFAKEVESAQNGVFDKQLDPISAFTHFQDKTFDKRLPNVLIYYVLFVRGYLADDSKTPDNEQLLLSSAMIFTRTMLKSEKFVPD